MFRSIFSDNLQPIATRGKKARGTYWSINTAATAVPLSAHLSPLVITTKLAAAILGGGLFGEGVFCRPSRCGRDKCDYVIGSRKLLKGTHYAQCAVTEDLTNLNVKTMNRLRNSEYVRTTWSWIGKIFAILTNGKKLTVKPFQPISELLAS